MLSNIHNLGQNNWAKTLKTQKVYSECLLRLGVLRVILLFCAFVFERAILS